MLSELRRTDANECQIDANEQTAPLLCYGGVVELEAVVLKVA